ncbi:cob(I)yrinic acid a,c-diamide adenosyltransferase [bacterium]|nr:cob(I)yrinic acid a,c-diamide adenosyltransferase [bacterium]
MKIYTKTGDDGTTGLFYGGRVRKDDTGPEAYGAVDEAVSAIGVARAAAGDDPIADLLLDVQRDLFVVAAELATDPSNHHKLQPGVSKSTPEMVSGLESAIDQITDGSGLPTEFVVPGGSSVAAAIDLARTIVRRAERRTVTHLAVTAMDGSAVEYLNRLADYLYVLARSAEDAWVPSRAHQSNQEGA